MNHTAKVDPAASEAMDKMAKNEMNMALEHKPDPEHPTDAEMLDDECSFVLSEN